MVVQICSGYQISPNWLLLGIGPKSIEKAKLDGAAASTEDQQSTDLRLKLLNESYETISSAAEAMEVELSDQQLMQAVFQLISAELTAQEQRQSRVGPGQVVRIIKQNAAQAD